MKIHSYQVNPMSRITGEGRAEILRKWGPALNQEGAGGGGESSICAWKLYINPLKRR